MSFGYTTDGSTAASTTAARIAFGVGASIPAMLGEASAMVAKPLTKPANGEEAPVIFATKDLLSDPPTGALPAIPEITQPRPWPVSSRASGPASTTETIAKKSTAAKATAEPTAHGQPPSRSANSAQGISHGQRRTQLVSAAKAKSAGLPPTEVESGAGAGGRAPTTPPLYSNNTAKIVPAAVAKMTSKPATGSEILPNVSAPKTFFRGPFPRRTAKSDSPERTTVAGSQSKGCDNIQPKRYIAAAPPEIGATAPPAQGNCSKGNGQCAAANFEPPPKSAPAVWEATTVIAKPNFQPVFTGPGM
mmetsp:Transcript_48286/g.121608  ORF Transcript_48286/g.121608 Transcript_48286/m.121608 type:complete len:304 (-) Transcript_48286:473-1384(-)